jgi:hypothetical protein
MAVDVGPGDEGMKILSYTVRSEFGGELSVSPESLRPGTVLDRINSALEE